MVRDLMGREEGVLGRIEVARSIAPWVRRQAG